MEMYVQIIFLTEPVVMLIFNNLNLIFFISEMILPYCLYTAVLESYLKTYVNVKK